jgi:hypothetical protein
MALGSFLFLKEQIKDIIIICSTITKLFARGGALSDRFCCDVFYYYEPRPVWTSLPIDLPITPYFIFFYNAALQNIEVD